jgi:tetratricopeptide (TPR) repeat protein
MTKKRLQFVLVSLSAVLYILMVNIAIIRAQETDPAATLEATSETTSEAINIDVPAYALLENLRYEPQGWNNCGPATLTSALSYFGYADNQTRAASWLKPNGEDKNVSPWQMAEFVNSQIPEMNIFALERYGGTLDTLKLLVSQGYPVIIEAGYDPEPERLGWMGHYLFVKGYDDSSSVFITNDSYLGEGVNYSYDHIQEFWQHFNYAYIVLYESGQEPTLLELLGTDADVRQNYVNALEIARAEAVVDNTDKFAWFNMGSNFVGLEMYNEAAIAYDQAFRLELPWRMLWYQFGPLEAYNQVGRYQDVLNLVQRNLNDGGGQYVEESFYYGGVAREGLGETARALDNYRGALAFNPNFTAAREAVERLSS